MATFQILLNTLREPQSAKNLTAREWDILLRLARHTQLLSRLAIQLLEICPAEKIPPAVADHLRAARHLSQAHQREVRWEVNRVHRALHGTGIDFVLLKGAAYVMANLPPAQGRLFQDIDFMVAKEQLDTVEQQLRWHGWFSGHLDEYDQRFYREWTHELPPMQHIKRKTILDVHYRILPSKARLQPDPKTMLESAVPLTEYEGVKVLAPEDMVLHSASHLFHDGELENGLRDLVDLDALLRHFGGNTCFWDRLSQRAIDLGLTRPLYYALKYTDYFLATPIPQNLKQQALDWSPSMGASQVMDTLFKTALAPDHTSCNTPFSGIARWFLYVRSHYLRMPLHLLIPHITRKAYKRRFGKQ